MDMLGNERRRRSLGDGNDDLHPVFKGARLLRSEYATRELYASALHVIGRRRQTDVVPALQPNRRPGEAAVISSTWL